MILSCVLCVMNAGFIMQAQLRSGLDIILPGPCLGAFETELFTQRSALGHKT